MRASFTIRLAQVICIALLGGHACPLACAEQGPPCSPRLRELSAAIEAGDETQIPTFWKEIKEKGTPLIESVEGVAASNSPHDVWLTFLWQGDATTNNVELVSGIAMEHPYDWRFTLLPKTDVWHLTIRMRTDLRASYLISVNDPLTERDPANPEAAKERMARLKRDPWNEHRNLRWSVVELDQAPPQPWIRLRPDVPKGSVEHSRFHSSLLENDRPVTVYRPPGYDPGGEPYPLLIVFDQEVYTFQIPTPTILNNLIQEKKIPAIVALFVGNAKDAREKELPCNDRFVQFLAEELLPKVRAEHHVTSDPRRVTVAGASLGGLAAAFFAFMRPELAGNVLSQSGSYWWAPGVKFGEKDPALEGEWLIRQYALTPAKHIRFFLEAGLRETLRVENRHFRDVLQAKGYNIAGYSEFNGSHDYLNWRGSLADGLIALFGCSGEK